MMTPERWRQIKEVLGHALEMEFGQRVGYLDDACRSDPSLRGEVERLLAAERHAGKDFLDGGATRDAVASPMPTLAAAMRLDSRIGNRIGPYKIVEQIGEGGMGAVYRAVRADDQYQKQVAIKLIQTGQDSAFIISRFKNERQILASLDHPNIARLLDGGTTSEGTPYFVMELIEGQPIDEYCDHHRLPTNDRLRVFLQVCAAVQFAHQRLIIHRDIKPGNILVGADSIPKLLDFGIAKLFDPENSGADATMTLFRALTPGYASPEQIKGEPITTASDVYSLGVVLYELLTGLSPYRLVNRTPHELAHAVCETEPERPSTAVARAVTSTDGQQQVTPASISAVREESPEKLRRDLRGDLDNIVLMALRKAPETRYSSVEHFAEDIRRHLENLPVSASRGTVRYRAAKFVSRHKAGVVVSVTTAVILLSAFFVTIREANIARQQSARAERRFSDVRKLANSLIFEIHDAIVDLPGATRARELLVQRAVQYLDSLAQEAAGDISLQRELATAYERVGDVQDSRGGENQGHSAEALTSFRKAEQIRADVAASPEATPEDRGALAVAYAKLAGALADTGDLKTAVDLDHKALEIHKALAATVPSSLQLQRSLAETYATLGTDLFREGDLEGAFENEVQAANLLERLSAANPSDAELSLGIAHVYLGISADLSEGLQKEGLKSGDYDARIIAIGERVVAANPGNVRYQMDLSAMYSSLASEQTSRHNFKGAIDSHRKALAIREAVAAADPTDVRANSSLAETLSRLGWTLGRLGDFKQDLQYQNRALQIREKLCAASPENEGLQESLAKSFGNMGKAEERGGENVSLPVSARIRHLRQATLWFQKAVGVWDKLRGRGPLSHYATKDLASSQEWIKKCEAELADLGFRKTSALPIVRSTTEVTIQGV